MCGRGVDSACRGGACGLTYSGTNPIALDPRRSECVSSTDLDVLAPKGLLVVSVPDDHGVFINHLLVHVAGAEACVSVRIETGRMGWGVVGCIVRYGARRPEAAGMRTNTRNPPPNASDPRTHVSVALDDASPILVGHRQQQPRESQPKCLVGIGVGAERGRFVSSCQGC